MAQIVVSTIDPINGSISTTIKLKDDHLNRIYMALKRQEATFYIESKKSKGETLEAYETVEEITKDISAQDMLQGMVERFVSDLARMATNIEHKIQHEKYLAQTEKIIWE